jgi:polysaccharide biosynthesis/export protein
MKILRIALFSVLAIYLISCGSQRKVPPYYLENATDTSGKGNVKFPELKIQKNDLLSIQVYSASTMPDRSDAPFNLLQNSSPGASGVLVDANGNIEYPQIGVIHAESLSKLELADIIKRKINEKDSVLTNPSVIIRFINFKVTVLGPVGREGVINVPGERVTILEAIGLAGGITDYGKKNTLKIIREINGNREIGYIDLSSKDLFESPYYNLMQNDMVIVEPTKQKARMAEQTLVASRISFALSVITAAAFIYNIFK